MIWEWDLSNIQKQNSFGSCQQRKLFPNHHAPDRLGNHLKPIRGTSHRGPGAYIQCDETSLAYHLYKRPVSTKGYILGARTTPRFEPALKEVTPSPVAYQLLWAQERKCPPAFAPFNAKVPRFQERRADTLCFPSPNTYTPEKLPPRKVTWPMKFGAPDWNLVPFPKKRTLKTELITDREFRKHRNRVAYLSLYYN
ncbi:protein pitchfork [Tachyglossus aculeatus]|uniref:protein pitchfork n=1 Tax=Tachyglossus aculeatus TaxID=9261 RepID=UPI0018F6208C|nr:protein pitchfork [Tachyglossus aculeatus]